MMVTISTIDHDTYLGLGIFLLMLTAAFILMRMVMSFRQFKKIKSDDWVCVVAFAWVIAFYVFNNYQYEGFFKKRTLQYQMNAGLAVPFVAAFSTGFSKAPVLLLYMRLFGVHRWVRWTCRITLIIMALGFLGSLIPPLIHCHPLDKPVTAAKWKRCGTANLESGVTSGTVSVAADLVIMLIPLRPILTLTLSRRRKIGITIIFCSGIFGIVASVVSLVYKIHLFRGGKGNVPSLLTTMITVEHTIALIVGCVPAIRGFWKGYIESSKFYASLGSLGSRLLSTRGSRASKRSNSNGSQDNNRDFDIDNHGDMNRPGANDPYILMEETIQTKDDGPKR
ncbi:hypothetical protein DM02DRAFT_70684 [Periconia macrospinosa]|uniref:Rhodopsin domain-containing protein n=1 Tax=Periconia macrospinosa TaxID=97972 RepID=A0A2V1E8U8_9PLEO|nr:hypothetical protein DM02DRAFT_70684 [Periconia macrospinosa]